MLQKDSEKEPSKVLIKERAIKVFQKWPSIQGFWQSNLPAIVIWLRWRFIFLFLPIVAFQTFPNGILLDASRTRLQGVSIWFDNLFGSWTRWDGGAYIQIALHGYKDDRIISFYPGYPALVRPIAFIFGLGQLNVTSVTIGGIFVSSIAALILCVLLYQLTLLDYKPETARLTVLYLMAFPVAFFLFAVYTEALFLALTVGAFYAARKNRWLLAMLLAAWAVVTKNQGALVVIALAVEYAYQQNWKVWRGGWRILYFGLPMASFGGWLLLNKVIYNHFFAFLAAGQKYWTHKFEGFWSAIIQAFNTVFNNNCDYDCFNDGFRPYLLDFSVLVLFLALLLVAIWAVWRGNLRISYLVLFLGCLLQPLTFPEVSYTLTSITRYFLIIFPAFMLLAQFGSRWKSFNFVYLSVSVPLLILMAARFNLWYWVA